jgi:hypothetical protein
MRILLAVLLALSLNAHADKKFILAGDSWAQLMCTFRAFNKAFSNQKVKKVKISCNDTSKLGAKASNWPGSKESNSLLSQAKNASVVYLSLGGNDFLYNWNKNMGSGEEQALIDSIVENMKSVVADLLSANPNLKILVSGYDFANFARYTHIDTYERLYKRMGEPTPFEINSAFLRLSGGMLTVADFRNVFYIHHYGVVHYYKGNGDHGLKKKQTLSPDFISTQENPLGFGGNVELPISKGSVLRIWPFYHDPFHLSPKGYFYLAVHSTRNYLGEWLR